MDLSPKVMWGAASMVAVILAIGAGFRDHRQRKRRNLDRIGLFDWRSVQVFALIAAIILAGLAFNL